MANETDNYNQVITSHLESIDNDRLLKIANDVSNFTKSYNNYIRTQQQFSKDNESYLKKVAEHTVAQSKTMNRMLEESSDLSNLQKSFKKQQEQFSERMRDTNQNIIKGLSDISRSTDDNVKNIEKLNRLTSDVQKENAQARLQDLIKDSKRFKLQSKYWMGLTGGIKDLTKEFHDFKKNPSQWMSEAMGNLLGKAVDKTIDGFSKSIKILGDSLKQFSDDLLNVIKEREKKAEDLSKSTLKDIQQTKSFQNDVDSLAYQITHQKGSTITAADFMSVQDNLKDLIAETIGVNKFQAKNAEEQAKIIETYTKALTINGEHAAEEIRKASTKYGSDYDSILKETRLSSQLAAEIKATENARAREFMELARQFSMSDLQKMGIKAENEAEGRLKLAHQLAEISVKRGEDFSAEDMKNILDTYMQVTQQNFVESLRDDKQMAGRQLVGELSSAASKGLGYLTDTLINSVSSKYMDIPVLQGMYGDLTNETNQKKVALWQQSKKSKEEYEKDLKELEEERQRAFFDEGFNWASDKTSMESNVKLGIHRLAALQVDESASQEKKEQAKRDALRDLIQDKLIKMDPEKFGSMSSEDLEILAKSFDFDENLKLKYTLDGLNDALKELPESLKDAGELLYNPKTLKSMEDSVDIMSGTVNLLKLKNDVGLDLNSGDLFGSLMKSGMNAAIGGVFDERYETKYKEMFDQLLKMADPIFSKLKEVLVDPVIDVLGGILGDIYVSVKKIFSNITGKAYSEEQQTYDRLKFTTSKGKLLEDLDTVNNGGKVGSKDYMSMLTGIKNISQSDIDSNKNLSKSERNKLTMYKAMTSSALNSNGSVMGVSSIQDLDLGDEFTKNRLSEMFSKVYFEGDIKEGKLKARNADNIWELLKNSQGIFSDNIDLFADFLSTADYIDKSKLLSVYNVLKNNTDSLLYEDLIDSFEIANKNKASFSSIFASVKNANLQKMLMAYLLLASDSDLYAYYKLGTQRYSLVPHKAENHLQFKKMFGDVEYFASGGVVGATKGGQHIIVGEAGHDEIIIPTDPAKRDRAQELLRLAEENYGLYSQSPDSISGSLQQKLEELLFDIRILMIQLDPMRDVLASQALMSAMGLLKNIKATNAELDSTIEEESGGATPLLGSPIQGAPGMDAIRKRIVDQALEMSGKPYGTLPKGVPTPPSAFVCNQLVNWAYSHALGAKNYSELLGATKLSQMNTVSGFIDAVGKNFPQAIRARSVSYSDLNGIAKPGDMVFTGDRATLQSPYNPDKHGHTGLYISNSEWIDASSWMVKGKQLGVGVHTPRKEQKYMLMNFLDQMPLSWYESKGLLSAEGIEDESTLTSHMVNMSYDPSLQSIPDASGVSTQVDRANKAKLENEKKKAEEKQNSFVKAVKDIEKKLGTEFSDKVSKPINIRISDDKAFCTTGQPNCSPDVYGVA